MNYSKAIFLISDQARAIMVIYEDCEHAERTMFKTLNPDISVNDYVVVQTNTRHHMTVCKVMEVDVDVDFDAADEVKWIIGTVNKADFDDLVRQESDAISKIKSAEKRKRRDELRDALVADAGEALTSLPIYTAKDEQ